MKTIKPFEFTKGVVLYPTALVVSIWLIYWVESHFGLNLKSYGIFPRKLEGLRGIFFSPFIHNSLSHLYHNSIPLVVLSMAMNYFYRPVALRIFFFGIIVSGFLTWCIGSPGYHMGASGYIYVLMSFLLFKGLLSNHYRLMALSLLVVFLYGGMIWYIFPLKDKMSWEGHLSGFFVGLWFAFRCQNTVPKLEKYDWEIPGYNEKNDPFLQHFDAEGNFVEIQEKITETKDKTNIKYTYNQED